MDLLLVILALDLVEVHVEAEAAVDVVALVALAEEAVAELEAGLEVGELGHVGADAVLGPLVLPESRVVAVAADPDLVHLRADGGELVDVEGGALAGLTPLGPEAVETPPALAGVALRTERKGVAEKIQVRIQSTEHDSSQNNII